MLVDHAQFRDRVRQGELLIGLFLQMGSPVAAEIAGRLGFDWALVDLEHGAGTEHDLLAELQALAAGGTPAIVRVESGARLRIGRALDMGAVGVMVPQVNTADMATEVVSYLRYPPAGARGVALSARGAGYGAVGHGEVGSLNKRTVGIVQVETAWSVSQVDAIAEVDGVDVLFVGPSDLSHSLGVPGAFDHSTFNEALNTIAEAAHRHRRILGVHLPRIDELARYRQLGFTFVSVGADSAAMASALRQLLVLGRTK